LCACGNAAVLLLVPDNVSVVRPVSGRSCVVFLHPIYLLYVYPTRILDARLSCSLEVGLSVDMKLHISITKWSYWLNVFLSVWEMCNCFSHYHLTCRYSYYKLLYTNLHCSGEFP
jgi:hypothetical protein